MMISYVDVQESSDSTVKTDRVGLNTYFDNVWRTAYGIDLLYEQGVDTNLRAVLSYGDTQIWFHPKADGINDATYGNHNDWPVLAHEVCAGVVNPGNTVSSPIRCAGPSGQVPGARMPMTAPGPTHPKPLPDRAKGLGTLRFDKARTATTRLDLNHS